MGTMIQLTAADGHKLSAYRAEPKGKPKGALIVVMEIFGVNSHIKKVTDEYAADGYLAIAPAMFDRGETDHSIPLEKAKEVAAAHKDQTHHYYAAGHGFNCDQRGSYNAEASKVARERCMEMLRKYVG